MKKGSLLILIFICFAILFVGCGNDISGTSSVNDVKQSGNVFQSTDDENNESTVSESENQEKEIKLVINGKNIADSHYVNFNCEYRYAELPFVAILEELGAETNRTDENTVSININDKTYILNTEKCTLNEENSELNLFQVAPGEMHDVVFKAVNDEFVIDSDSAKLFINVILKLKMNIDIDNKIITISE